MELRQIAELAALASARGQQLIQSRAPLPAEPLNAYWHHSRQRFHVWMRQLAAWRAAAETAPAQVRDADWQSTAETLAEIFLAEMLVRVWTTVLSYADAARNASFAEPIARDVQSWQQVVRLAALELMANGPVPSGERLREMDRLRRRAERWTDVLVARVVERQNARGLAIEFDRTPARLRRAAIPANPHAERMRSHGD